MGVLTVYAEGCDCIVALSGVEPLPVSNGKGVVMVNPDVRWRR